MLVWIRAAECSASSRKRSANSSSWSGSGRITLTATRRWRTSSCGRPDVGHAARGDPLVESVAPPEQRRPDRLSSRDGSHRLVLRLGWGDHSDLGSGG